MRILGLEFLPHLEEGNLWIRAAMPPSISLEEGNDFVNRMRMVIKGFPEIETVVSQQGRPDDGTDATGFFNAEFFAPLKPAKAWRKGVNKDKLIEEVNEALEKEFPGVGFNFSQYIQDNVEEAVSGVKGENSVKLIGNDLVDADGNRGEDQRRHEQRTRRRRPCGIHLARPTDAAHRHRPRKAAARYGLAPGDINSAVQTAVGGQAAGDLYEDGSDRHFPLVVRLAPKYRQNIETIKRIPSACRTHRRRPGAPERGRQRRARVRRRPTSTASNRSATSPSNSASAAATSAAPCSRRSASGRRSADSRRLPCRMGRRVRQPQERTQRLAVAVPIAIALILLLLYISFGSLRDTLLAGSAIPMALIGGMLASVLSGMPFSISAAIGFVALFGIAAMNGIMVLGCYNRLIDGGLRARGSALPRPAQCRCGRC